MGRKLIKAAIVATALAAVLGTGSATAAPSRAAISNCTPGADWGTLRPDLATQALALINAIADPVQKAQLYNNVFGTCCSTPQTETPDTDD